VDNAPIPHNFALASARTYPPPSWLRPSASLRPKGRFPAPLEGSPSLRLRTMVTTASYVGQNPSSAFFFSYCHCSSQIAAADSRKKNGRRASLTFCDTRHVHKPAKDAARFPLFSLLPGSVKNSIAAHVWKRGRRDAALSHESVGSQNLFGKYGGFGPNRRFYALR